VPRRRLRHAPARDETIGGSFAGVLWTSCGPPRGH